MSAVARRAAFDFVRYATVWEDADILCQALAPTARGGRLLSIASAGDNALALLTLDPAEVVAVDLNPAQIACVELRRVAFRRLDYEPLLAFLGILPSGNRDATYRRLRSELPAEAAAFWDGQPREIARGAIHAGKFERYFALFRTRILPLVHDAATVRALRGSHTFDAQHRFYTERWNTWRWRALFKVFFSRVVMGRLGRDPAFFDHVEGSVAERILERTRYALTAVPVSSNPYLAFILTGNFPQDALPLYLRRESFEPIRARLDRLTTRVLPADQATGPFHAFNLSDIFEYMSNDDHARVYAALVDRAVPGARLAYWNMLAPRGVPQGESRAGALPDLADSLHARDNAWFYQRFHVDVVEPETR